MIQDMIQEMLGGILKSSEPVSMDYREWVLAVVDARSSLDSSIACRSIRLFFPIRLPLTTR